MNSIVEMEKNQTVAGLGDVPAFVTLPTKGLNELTEDAREMFAKIAEIRTNMVLTVIDAQSSDEFNEMRSIVFENVVRTNKALGNLAKVLVSAQALDRIAWQAFAELEADLTQHGTKKFGDEAKEQAIFTVWTLRKINRLLSKVIHSKPLRGEDAEKDREIAREFSFYLLWSYFHLECMVVAMRFDRSIQFEVLDEICDGLRSAVNAYGFLRQGLDLRFPADPEPEDDSTWTEEDDELLASSMNDMDSMEIEEY